MKRASCALVMAGVIQCVQLQLLSGRPIYVIPRRATPRSFNADQRKRKARAQSGRPRHLHRRRAGGRRAPPPRVQECRTDHCRPLRLQSRSGSARPILVRGGRRVLRPTMVALSHPRGPCSPHARHEGNRGCNLWPDRALARSRCWPDPGLAMKPALLDELTPGFGGNLIRYYEHARKNDLYVSFAVTPPSGIRSREIFAGEARDDPTLQVIAEGDDGVIISGMKMLATGAAF